MSILVCCPGCKAEARVPAASAGKRGKCRKCGGVVTVPSPSDPIPARSASATTCLLCGADLSDSERTKDAAGNHFCVDCWRVKSQRQQQAKARATVPAGGDGDGGDDEYELARHDGPPTPPTLLPCSSCSGSFASAYLRQVNGVMVCRDCLSSEGPVESHSYPGGGSGRLWVAVTCGTVGLLCFMASMFAGSLAADFTGEFVGGLLGHAACVILGTRLMLVARTSTAGASGERAWYFFRWAALVVALIYAMLAAYVTFRTGVYFWVTLPAIVTAAVSGCFFLLGPWPEPGERQRLWDRGNIATGAAVLACVLPITFLVQRPDRPSTLSAYEAALAGDLQELQSHVYWKSDLKSTNLFGYTPLHAASGKGHWEAAELLLAHGADVNRVNSGETPLHLAAGEGQIGMVELLLSRGADVDGRSNTDTPLSRAAEKGHTQVVNLLLEHKAKLNPNGTLSDAPLVRAVREGHADVASLLLAAGADTGVKSSVSRWTALHWAASGDRVDLVRLLLDKGADASLQSEEGETPLDVAKRFGHTDVVKLLPGGQTQQTSPKTAGAAKPAATRSVKQKELPAPTVQQAKAWAENLEQSLNAGDFTPLVDGFDADAFTRRAVGDVGLTPEGLEAVGAILKKQPQQLAQHLPEVLRPKGVKCLHVTSLASGPAVRLRLLFKDGDFNYWDLLLGPSNDGGVRIIDIYDFGLGQWQSVPTRRLVMPGLMASRPGGPGPLGEFDREFLRHVDDVQSMLRHAKAERFLPAIAVYRDLPPKLKLEKTLFLIYVQAVAGSGDEAGFRQATDEYRAAFPDDAGLDLWMVHRHALAKDYGQLLETLGRLQMVVGDAPYFDSRRAAVHLLRGEADDAKRLALAAVRAEPTLAEPHFTLLGMSLLRREYDETARLLTVLEKDLGETIPDLTQDPDFSEFVASPQYRAWFAARGGAKTDAGGSRTAGGGDAQTVMITVFAVSWTTRISFPGREWRLVGSKVTLGKGEAATSDEEGQEGRKVMIGKGSDKPLRVILHVEFAARSPERVKMRVESADYATVTVEPEDINNKQIFETSRGRAADKTFEFVMPRPGGLLIVDDPQAKPKARRPKGKNPPAEATDGVR